MSNNNQTAVGFMRADGTLVKGCPRLDEPEGWVPLLVDDVESSTAAEMVAWAEEMMKPNPLLDQLVFVPCEGPLVYKGKIEFLPPGRLVSSNIEREAECWRTLMEACGHWQDGSDKVVKLIQDEAVRECGIYVKEVGKNEGPAFWGKTFEQAVSAWKEST